jgi:hypothetical protein
MDPGSPKSIMRSPAWRIKSDRQRAVLAGTGHALQEARIVVIIRRHHANFNADSGRGTPAYGSCRILYVLATLSEWQ